VLDLELVASIFLGVFLASTVGTYISYLPIRRLLRRGRWIGEILKKVREGEVG